ncbi:hypothetical protein IVB25_23490 [Bradyrhizobium sp. 193]|uniref:hypothetical protein n=1 Tax=Bradyrhizobium sp. 193 TaxID=2782661 RepID=UPI001FFA7457|nr:hypothetical protein [Bradyrhizobium sp. 193]MCK1485573.1 hypothetical protein [Bradyrhizobium sp. 193]
MSANSTPADSKALLDDLNRTMDLRDSAELSATIKYNIMVAHDDFIRVTAKPADLVPWVGAAVNLYIGRGLDLVEKKAKAQLDEDARKIVVSGVDKIRSDLGDARDTVTVGAVLENLLGAQLLKISDPETRDAVLARSILLVQKELETLKADTANAVRGLNAAINDLNRQVAPLSKQVSRLKKEVAAANAQLADTAKGLTEQTEVRQSDPSLGQGGGATTDEQRRALKRVGQTAIVIGAVTIEAANLLSNLGIEGDAPRVLAVAGNVGMLFGRALSGTLDPLSAIQGINSLVSLFNRRPDPVLTALNKATSQILDAIRDLDRRNQERYLDTVRRIANVESKVLEIHLGISTLLVDGLGPCRLLIAERLQRENRWLAQSRFDAFLNLSEFEQTFSRGRSVLQECKTRLQNIFVLTHNLTDGIADRFMPDETRYRLSMLGGGGVDRARSAAQQIFRMQEETYNLSSDLLSPELLPALSIQANASKRLDQIVQEASKEALCRRENGIESASIREAGAGRVCGEPFEWRTFFRNFGVSVDAAAADATIRLLISILPYYEMLGSSDGVDRNLAHSHIASEKSRRLIEEMLKGAQTLGNVVAAQQNALTGQLLLPVVARILASRWDDLAVTCEDVKREEGEDDKPVKHCSFSDPVGLLVNGENFKEADQRAKIRKRVVDVINGRLSTAALDGLPANAILKKNLARYFVYERLKASGWNVAAYEIARNYEQRRMIERLIGPEYGFSLVESNDNSTGSRWAIRFDGDVVLPLPPSSDLLDGGLDTTGPAQQAAILQGAIRSAQGDYVFAPALLNGAKLRSVRRLFRNPSVLADSSSDGTAGAD